MESRALQAVASPTLSVIVPCCDEEAVLPELGRRLVGACRRAVGEDFEIILVNDGSRDATWVRINELVAALPGQVLGVDLSRNYGHQIALSAGLTFARGDRVLIIDSDLQDPPELLGEMMGLMDAGADVVYGQRTDRDGEGRFKLWSAASFYRVLSRLTDIDIPRDTGDFRPMGRRVVDALLQMPEHHRFLRGMVAWVGFRQVALPYRRAPRYAGSTKYPLRKMVRVAIDAFTGFSIAPLRLSLFLALTFLVLAGALAVYAVYSWLVLDAVRGWTSLLILFLVFSSAQLACLGIIGEYVGRTYMQAKNRPLFLVRELASATAAGPPSTSEDENSRTAATASSL